MPIYEYELTIPGCIMCPGRFEALQGVDEEPLAHCPTCGLEVKRVVSKFQRGKGKSFSAGDAARKGLTTYKRVREGEWEKVAGPGVDGIVGTDEDKEVVKKKPKVDLDQDGS